MINLKILGSAAIVCAALATPAIAQQAIQEPGAYALYQFNRSYGAGAPYRYSDRDVGRSSFAYVPDRSFHRGHRHR